MRATRMSNKSKAGSTSPYIVDQRGLVLTGLNDRVYRFGDVVELTADEHAKLVSECEKKGCTAAALRPLDTPSQE